MFGIAIPPVGNTVTEGSSVTVVIAAIVLAVVGVVLLGLALWGARSGHAAERSVDSLQTPQPLPHAA